VVGWDQSRLSMVLAVLEAHCGVRLSSHDVYFNVAADSVSRAGRDLAAAAALVSSLANAPLPADAVYFGEISLSGAGPPVAQTPARLKEAQKLGFARAILPEAARGDGGSEAGLLLQPVTLLSALVADIAATGRPLAAKLAARANKTRANKTGDAAAGPRYTAAMPQRRGAWPSGRPNWAGL